MNITNFTNFDVRLCKDMLEKMQYLHVALAKIIIHCHWYAILFIVNSLADLNLQSKDGRAMSHLCIASMYTITPTILSINYNVPKICFSDDVKPDGCIM